MKVSLMVESGERTYRREITDVDEVQYPPPGAPGLLIIRRENDEFVVPMERIIMLHSETSA